MWKLPTFQESAQSLYIWYPNDVKNLKKLMTQNFQIWFADELCYLEQT